MYIKFYHQRIKLKKFRHHIDYTVGIIGDPKNDYYLIPIQILTFKDQKFVNEQINVCTLVYSLQ